MDLALLTLAATIVPAVWRVACGPSDADRAIGADHVFFVLVGSVALLALGWGRTLLLDLVLVATLTGFLSALLLGRYLGTPKEASTDD